MSLVLGPPGCLPALQGVVPSSDVKGLHWDAVTCADLWGQSLAPSSHCRAVHCGCNSTQTLCAGPALQKLASSAAGPMWPAVASRAD